MTGFRKLWDRIMKLAELPPHVTPHVLRHSFASLAGTDLQYSEPTIAALIGHKGHTTTSRYVHAADAVLLAAADAVANKTLELMGETKPAAAANMVPRQPERPAAVFGPCTSAGPRHCLRSTADTGGSEARSATGAAITRSSRARLPRQRLRTCSMMRPRPPTAAAMRLRCDASSWMHGRSSATSLATAPAGRVCWRKPIDVLCAERPKRPLGPGLPEPPRTC
jgi:hypothetical protein